MHRSCEALGHIRTGNFAMRKFAPRNRDCVYKGMSHILRVSLNYEVKDESHHCVLGISGGI